VYIQEDGKAPLHYAAEHGRKDVMQFLIDKHHADIEARDQV
jgi:ankyrin repeat protein